MTSFQRHRARLCTVLSTGSGGHWPCCAHFGRHNVTAPRSALPAAAAAPPLELELCPPWPSPQSPGRLQVRCSTSTPALPFLALAPALVQVLAGIAPLTCTAIVPPSRPYPAVSPSARLSRHPPQPLLLLSPPQISISVADLISTTPSSASSNLRTNSFLGHLLFSCLRLFVCVRLELPAIGIHPRLAGRIL